MSSLVDSVADPDRRRQAADDAVREAGLAIADRGGLAGHGARLGLQTITRLRPGFLERQVHAMLPELAAAVDPHWQDGIVAGDPNAWLIDNADVVADAMLQVTDRHAAAADDLAAKAVYDRLRPRAQRHVAAHMDRIGDYVGRWSGSHD